MEFPFRKREGLKKEPEKKQPLTAQQRSHVCQKCGSARVRVFGKSTSSPVMTYLRCEGCGHMSTEIGTRR